MIIRPETTADIAAIHALNEVAFPTNAEAGLVDRLRVLAEPYIACVAVSDDKTVGHIAYSPVTIDGDTSVHVMGLAPMAVAPACQRNGIGSELVEAGICACRDAGVAALVVLGHPEFYPRFGFLPASNFGIGCEYDVPDEVFMAMELTAGSLAGRSGTIRYHPTFSEL